ncbi:vesicle-associated membrane protein 7-like [Convolutriloba macropyga]|uniref:vesicle-associated membrane protein 7-like n=1 Tax=Convolutriloba macropyga TaxID=536237 RepID=UPI003F51E949
MSSRNGVSGSTSRPGGSRRSTSGSLTNSLSVREGILYALVARNTAVLAKYGRCAGNFTEVSEQVLAKISPSHTKLSYQHGNFFFHYISDNGLTFFCITDENFPRVVAFQFLEEIKNTFYKYYGSLGLTAMPYSMNTEFGAVLQTQMKRFSASADPNSRVDEKMRQIQQQTEEVKGIMIQNIETITERGESLELLVEKSMELSYDSVNFHTRSRDLRRVMFWRNFKLTILAVVIVIVIVYLIMTIACGGFNWHKCV